jgi:hypothetical protein
MQGVRNSRTGEKYPPPLLQVQEFKLSGRESKGVRGLRFTLPGMLYY